MEAYDEAEQKIIELEVILGTTQQELHTYRDDVTRIVMQLDIEHNRLKTQLLELTSILVTDSRSDASEDGRGSIHGEHTPNTSNTFNTFNTSMDMFMDSFIDASTVLHSIGNTFEGKKGRILYTRYTLYTLYTLSPLYTRYTL